MNKDLIIEKRNKILKNVFIVECPCKHGYIELGIHISELTRPKLVRSTNKLNNLDNKQQDNSIRRKSMSENNLSCLLDLYNNKYS